MPVMHAALREHLTFQPEEKERLKLTVDLHVQYCTAKTGEHPRMFSSLELVLVDVIASYFLSEAVRFLQGKDVLTE